MKERRDAVLKFIALRNEVTLSQLVAEFRSWSEMTLRRDLAYLEKNGQIILTRGGARMMPRHFGLTESLYSEREQCNFEAKQEVAVKAVSLIEPGKSIYLDAGTTVMHLAKIIPDINLVVVTAAPNVALELLHSCEEISVVQLGGTLVRRTFAISDPDVERQLANLNIDTAFVTASGFDEKAGFSVGSQMDCLLKRAVIARSRRVVMMFDSSKYGVILPFTFAGVEDVTALAVDGGLPAAARRFLQGRVKIL